MGVILVYLGANLFNLEDFRIIAVVPILLTVLALSRYIYSSESVFNISIASTLLIGLSPIYLVGRGFITKSELSFVDLPIYLIIMLISFKVIFSPKSNFQNQNKNFVSSFLGLLLIFGVQIWLSFKSLGDAAAWIASGDSKNHLVNAVDLTRYGYLDPSTFLTQPVSSPTFLSLVLSQNNKDFIDVSTLLIYSVQTYAFFWALLIGLLGLSISAIGNTIWRLMDNKNSKYPALLGGLLSLSAFLSIFLGPATYDGFFTALCGITAVLSLIAWLLEVATSSKYNTRRIFIGFLLFASSIMAWMFIAPLTLLIFVFGSGLEIRKYGISRKKVLLFGFLVIGLLFLTVHFSAFGQELISKAKQVLNVSGAVSTPNTNFYFALIISLIVSGILVRPRFEELSNIVISIGIMNFIALTGFKIFSNLEFFAWNYYLLKYQWIMSAAMFAFLLSLLVIQVYRGTYISWIRIISISLTFAAAYLFTESLVPVNQVWQKVFRGWENPRSEILNTVLAEDIDRKNPTLFFQYGYEGDAMLGNFWLTAFTDPVEPIKGWNYIIKTNGNPKQLCDVNAYYPEVKVITSSKNLKSELSKYCPEEKFNIQIESSINPN